MAYSTDGRGGGNAMPPYIQARKPATRSVITPKSTVMPGETRGNQQYQAGMRQYQGAITPKKPGINAQTGVGMRPATATPGAAAPTVADAPAPQTLYDFFKRDLEDKRKSAMAGTEADAASRGVYYGTPLTTSQGDIQTEYLRGLGQLQAGILQNEQQNELSRLGIASGLLSSAPQAQSGGIDPAVFQMLGSLFGGSSAVSGQRSGPSLTPPAQLKKPPVTIRNSGR